MRYFFWRVYEPFQTLYELIWISSWISYISSEDILYVDKTPHSTLQSAFYSMQS